MVWRRIRAHCNQKLLKGAVVLLGVSLVVFIVASSLLYDDRRLNYGGHAQASCGPCSCICPSKRRMFPSASGKSLTVEIQLIVNKFVVFYDCIGTSKRLMANRQVIMFVFHPIGVLLVRLGILSREILRLN